MARKTRELSGMLFFREKAPSLSKGGKGRASKRKLDLLTLFENRGGRSPFI